MTRTYEVAITQHCNDLLWGYIDAVKTEIGGYGYVSLEDNAWVWHKVGLITQEVSGGGVDYTKDLFEAIEQADKDGVLDDPRFAWCWWHSHADMHVYFSTTDEEDMHDKLRLAGLKHAFEFVGNRKHEYQMRLTSFDHPLLQEVEVPIKLSVLSDPAVDEEVEANIKKYVTKKTWSKGKSASDWGMAGWGLDASNPEDRQQVQAMLNAEEEGPVWRWGLDDSLEPVKGGKPVTWWDKDLNDMSRDEYEEWNTWLDLYYAEMYEDKDDSEAAEEADEVTVTVIDGGGSVVSRERRKV